MKRSATRILTTHTGSLHRPPELEELYRARCAGEPHDEEAYESALRDGVAEVVRSQAQIGVDVVSDGELSKIDFFNYAKHRLSGLEQRPVDTGAPRPAPDARNPFLHSSMRSAMYSADVRRRFAGFYADTESPAGPMIPPSLVQLYMPLGTAVEPPAVYAVVDRLAYDDAEVTRDIANLTAALTDVEVQEAFLPVVAPVMLATRLANEHYADDEELYYAMADALNAEYRAIVDAGLLLQLDDVSLPGRYRLQVPTEGIEAFHRWADLAVDVTNHALRGIPHDRVRYHMCWSSQNAPHTDDAPLQDLVGHILKLDVQAYQIEAANVRHSHEWEVWRDVALPEGAILMPGVISHATNVIEHPRFVAQCIRRYTDLLGFENVIAATDCGFRWRTHPEIAGAKLEALVEGARLASAERVPS